MPTYVFEGTAIHESMGERKIQMKIVNARPDAKRAAELFLYKHPQFTEAELSLKTAKPNDDPASRKTLKQLMRTPEEMAALESGTRRFGPPSGRDMAKSGKITKQTAQANLKQAMQSKDSLTREEGDTRPARNRHGQTTSETSTGGAGGLIGG